MALISKRMVIDLLIKRRDGYRKDTEVGQNLREGIDRAIHDIEDAYERTLFSLKDMGESDLTNLMSKLQEKLDKLKAEKVITVFCIQGFYDKRYTRCSKKAEAILKEEFLLMLGQIEEDYADSKMDIQMLDIKESNLKDYKIEVIDPDEKSVVKSD